MDFAKIIIQFACPQISNNFYCNARFLSSADSKYLQLSERTLLPSKKILAFKSPILSFVPINIRNSFQEAIVVSTVNDNNMFADATNNWIKRHKDKNHHSLFYKEIFKALLIKKIEVVAPLTKLKNTDHKGILTQKYIWNKGWGQPFFSFYLNNRHNISASRSSKKLLINQLAATPVFVVKNGFNEIILGHPLYRIKRTMFEQIAFSYSNLLHYSKQTSPLSTGLFFFHLDDALEFKNFIQSNMPVASEHMEIKVESIGLHFAYQMSRNLFPDTQFRFIPDFKEVGDLVFKHQKDKHLVFHKNQYFGKDFFQGQPIYIIQPVTMKNRNGQSNIIKFTGKNDSREVVFTSREAANQSWTNFIKNKPALRSVTKPTLLVYNLESFLKDKEFSNTEKYEKFVVINNKKAYLAAKGSMTLPDSNRLSKHLKLNVKPKLFFVKLWVKRLLSTLIHE